MNPARLRSHNLVATFADGRRAETARSELERSGVEPGHIELEGAANHRGAMRGEVRTEAEEMTGLPAVVMTRSMTVGAVSGAVVGGIIGAILLLPLAFLPVGLSLPARVVIAVIIGAITGSTAGAVFYGARRAETHEEEPVPVAEQGITVAVHSDDVTEIDRAAEVLARLDPERLDRIGADGRPV